MYRRRTLKGIFNTYANLPNSLPIPSYFAGHDTDINSLLNFLLNPIRYLNLLPHTLNLR